MFFPPSPTYRPENLKKNSNSSVLRSSHHLFLKAFADVRTFTGWTFADRQLPTDISLWSNSIQRLWEISGATISQHNCCCSLLSFLDGTTTCTSTPRLSCLTKNLQQIYIFCLLWFGMWRKSSIKKELGNLGQGWYRRANLQFPTIVPQVVFYLDR